MYNHFPRGVPNCGDLTKFVQTPCNFFKNIAYLRGDKKKHFIKRSFV